MALIENMLRMGRLMMAFTVIGTAAVAFTYAATHERIAENDRLAQELRLNALVPPNQRDNNIVADRIQLTSQEFFGTPHPITVYRARWQGEPVAAVFESIAPDGYSGAIKLLVAIHADGFIAGVRVVSHKETPGLGDYIEDTRSNWILGFDSRSLSNPSRSGWRVKKDGGVFDQVTGATVTPRAIVKAVHKCLQYFADHRDTVFATTTPSDVSHDQPG